MCFREGGVCGVFEGGDDIFFFSLDDSLDGFEVSAGKFVRESKEGLVLLGILVNGVFAVLEVVMGGSYQEEVVLRIQLGGGEFGGHGGCW